MVNKNRKLSNWSKKTIKSVILIFIILFSFLITVRSLYGEDPGGQWVYISSRTETYSVNFSTDDAILTEYGDFANSALMIPLRLPQYNTRFAFRIHVDDAVNNATHRELVDPGNAYFEVWSDDPTFAGSLTGLLSCYMSNETTVETFTNYTDLMNRPNHFFLGNTEISEFGRVGATGLEWRDFSSNMLHNALNNMNLLPYTDNDTIAFIFQTTKGESVYFWTYDYDSNHAPRLTVQWDLYEWMDILGPVGYPGAEFVEEWKPGYFIWEYEGANYTTYEIDYREWEFIDQVGGYLYEWNTTGINPYNVDCSSDKFRKRNATADSPFDLKGSLKLKVNAYSVINYGGADLNRLNFALLSFCNFDGSMVDNHGGSGYEHASFTLRHNAVNDTNNIYRYCIFIDSALGASTSSSDHFNITSTPHWLDLMWDFPNQFLKLDIYSDSARTNLLDSIQKGPSYEGIESTGYNYDMVFNTYTLGPTWNGVMQNFTIMSLPGPSNESAFVVADEDGDPLHEDDSLEGARDWIDWATTSANPDYDALPNLGNNIIAIMGLMGLVMIPGSFIMFGHCVKDGDWVQGFYYLLVMFFVGLGFVTVWLFG